MADDITHIGQLIHDPKNARAHSPRNIGMLVDSLQAVGAARSIVIDENGRILAGNGTIDAAGQAGIERVRVIEADGEEIIAVRRRGLTEAQKVKLSLYDNRTAELADWSPEVLSALNDEGALDGLWREDEIDRLLGTGEPIDPNELWKGMPEFEYNPLAAKSINVHFESLDDLHSFAEFIGQKITDKTRSIWYPEKANNQLADKRYTDES